jgi:hypothetical protein
VSRIVTSYIYPPIPRRDYDWCATLEDYDGADDSRDPIGFGATEAEAIDDLQDQIGEFARGPFYLCAVDYGSRRYYEDGMEHRVVRQACTLVGAQGGRHALGWGETPVVCSGTHRWVWNDGGWHHFNGDVAWEAEPPVAAKTGDKQ